MKCSTLLASALIALLASAAVADDPQEIRKLIPAATAMRQADFEALAKSPAPKEEDVAEKSLTLKLFAMKAEPDQKPIADFHFVGDVTPRPSDLAEEIYRTAGLGTFRVLTSPVTFIHAERITEFTCDVEGDKATGVATFVVPKLYQGKVGYVAARKDGTWQITELTMPGHAIHQVRGDDGKWADRQ